MVYGLHSMVRPMKLSKGGPLTTGIFLQKHAKSGIELYAIQKYKHKQL